MSKRFKGKTCVYCGAAPSMTTGDHVFAREFFINVRRGNLPKVPACEACNHEKSKLEHYLTAVLPFGGRHTDSAQNLSTLGGMKLSGDPQAPHEECSIIGGVTATREGLAKFLTLLNPNLQPAAQLRQTG